MPKIKHPLTEFLTKFDFLPPRLDSLDKLRKILNKTARFYGFEKISTPPLEEYKIFLPLENALMLEERPPFAVETKTEEFILPPSAIFGVLRAYAFHKMADLPQPLKFLFEAPVFWRGSEAEKLRLGREWGLAVLGEDGPVGEAELIRVLFLALQEAGWRKEDLQLRLNVMGCSDCRSDFRRSLTSYLKSRAGRLCKNCRKNLKNLPTKILSCHEEKCGLVASHLPSALDFLCDECRAHLRGLLEFLDELKIPYFLDPKFFRDGFWFNKIIFEVVFNPGETPPLDDAVPFYLAKRFLILAEGGRVSRAAELLTGKKIEAVSVSLFLDAVEGMLLRHRGWKREPRRAKVFMVQLGELAKRKSFAILEMLRREGIDTRETLGRDSIKSQLRLADRFGAEVALILGQKEALEDTIIVRETKSGMQETVPQEKMIEFLNKKLKK